MTERRGEIGGKANPCACEPFGVDDRVALVVITKSRYGLSETYWRCDICTREWPTAETLDARRLRRRRGGL